MAATPWTVREPHASGFSKCTVHGPFQAIVIQSIARKFKLFTDPFFVQNVLDTAGLISIHETRPRGSSG